MNKPSPECASLDRELAEPESSMMRQALENPGFRSTMPGPWADPAKQEAFFRTYEWIRDRTTNPMVSPEHMQETIWRLTFRQTWSLWRGHFMHDPSKKELLGSIHRQHRNIPVAMLLAVEEIEELGKSQADPGSVDRCRRTAPIEEQIWLLEQSVEDDSFDPEDVDTIFQRLNIPWRRVPYGDRFTLEREPAAEPIVPGYDPLTEQLAQECLRRKEFADIKVETGLIEGTDRRGTKVRVLASQLSTDLRVPVDVTITALRAERLLIEAGLTS